MTQTSATPQHDLSKIDVARIRLQLAEMRAELEKRAGARDVLDLRRVEAAQRRLANGVYGACESCARPVAKARLLAMPHVRYCTHCSNGEQRPQSSAPDRITHFA